MSQSILCIIKQAPYGTHKGSSAIDAAMLLAALDHKISLAFIEDGIWHLMPEQHPEELPMKAYTKALKALDIYDIEKVYAIDEDLSQRGLKQSELLIPITLVNRPTLGQLMTEHDYIFTV